MKKKFFATLIFIFVMSFSACSGNKSVKEEQTSTSAITDVVPQNIIEPAQDNSETSLDWAGIYEGTIPAASCPGIKMTLTLNFDTTYILVSDYIDEKDEVFTDEGTFSFVDGSIIDLDIKNDADKFFKVENGRLIMLGIDMTPAEGELADKYILTQKEVFYK